VHTFVLLWLSRNARDLNVRLIEKWTVIMLKRRILHVIPPIKADHQQGGGHDGVGWLSTMEHWVQSGKLETKMHTPNRARENEALLCAISISGIM
jgi:hypothetical protein